MNDLISRSEVLELLYKIFDEYYMSTDKNPSILIKSFGTDIFGSFGTDVFKKIKEMPTAYSVDKVVEEIKTLKEDALAEYNIGEYNLDNNIGNSIAENYRKDMNEGKCFAYDEAIEIVKQGGVSDDACEWKAGKSNDEWQPNCEPNSTYNVFGVAWFKRCPYCGKKIKTVGD